MVSLQNVDLLIKTNDSAWRYSGSHIRLQCFYCQYIDADKISRIIKSQTELQILGLDTSQGPAIILKVFKKLRNAQLSLPIVIACAFMFNQISIFPAFCSVDRRATIPRLVAQFIHKDQTVRKKEFQINVMLVAIYLIDSSDMPSTYALAKEMYVNFPRVKWLYLWFERQCDIVSF